MNFNREKESSKTDLNQQKLDIEREKIANESRNKQIELAIAKENQSKSELKAKGKI
jgi:hypothetical protein